MAKQFFAAWFWRAKHWASGFWAGAGIVPNKVGVEFVVPVNRAEYVVPDGLTAFALPKDD